MKDLGPAKKVLGIQIRRDRTRKLIWLSQENYIVKVLEKFNLHKAKPVSTPLAGHTKLSSSQCPRTKEEREDMRKVPYLQAIGSLMYAATCTRPDIAYAVSVVSRFASNPGREHWKAVKWILRYLRGTSNMCLSFGNKRAMLTSYTDADMAGDADSRKSTSGYLSMFAGGAVSWQSKLQKCVALSTTEAEYIAATEACKELLWLKRFLLELGHKQEDYILNCDSQSAIHLTKNASFHYRTKHIDSRYHWIREAIEGNQLQINKVRTEENWSDMLTKVVSAGKLEDCRKGASIVNSPLTAEGGDSVGFLH